MYINDSIIQLLHQDNIAVVGKYVYLNAGRRRFYFYDAERPALGQGGMGVVLGGLDCMTGEMVAIKQIHDRYADIPSIRQKARVESALTFSHPNIVEMLGCCELRSGKGPMFIISRYVKGFNADKFFEHYARYYNGTDRAVRITNILLPILDALDFLHSQSIYHLDIKPSNIMIDGRSVARLMDLGIANSFLDQASMEASECGVVGTPRFAAPEQFYANGNQVKVSARCDLYEYAVTLYELITGKNPFSAPSLRECYHRHYHGYLPGHDSIPPDLMMVLQRATLPQVGSRYQSAREMKSAILEAISPIPAINKKK